MIPAAEATNTRICDMDLRCMPRRRPITRQLRNKKQFMLLLELMSTGFKKKSTTYYHIGLLLGVTASDCRGGS